MTEQLYATSPTFRRALDECAAILDPRLDEPLGALLFGDGPATRIHQTAYAQPALVAVEIALARLWRSFGIVPDAVVGHSSGEIAAACVAGALTLEDALLFAAERGRLMQTLPLDGGMAAIMASPELVRDVIAGVEDRLAISGLNGPEAVTISGEAGAVQSAVGRFRERGIVATPLSVSHAFHSPLIEPILAPLERLASRGRVSTPLVAMAEGTTGELVRGASLDAAYWRRQARAPVLFARAVASVDAHLAQVAPHGPRAYVEIGPRPVLLGLARGSLQPANRSFLASLHPNSDDWSSLLDALGRLHLLGANVDWRGVDRDYQREIVSLPTYPFERSRHWIAAAEGPRDAARAARVSDAAPCDGDVALEPPRRDDLLAAVPAERRRMLEEYFRHELAHVLGLPPAMLDARQPLQEVGLDSIMVLEVRRRVERALQVPLPVVSFAQGASIGELADALGDLLAATADGGSQRLVRR
jgi:acyl transferase domain-containing protein